MGYSRTLNSLKTVIAVATAFNIAACLVTETKQAAFAQEVIVTEPEPVRPARGIVKFSGRSPIASSFTFDLVDVQDQAPNDDSLGVFPGAIQNFNYQSVSGRSGNNNPAVCGQEVCPPATLTVTKLSLESRSNLPTDFPFVDRNFASVIDVSNQDVDILRYDVNFASPDSELFWLIQSNDSSLINDLSALIKVDKTKIVGQYSFARSGFYFTFDDISGQFTSQQVPESSNTHALLGLAVLGSVSLLKRNKRFLKSVTQNSSSLSQKST